MNPEDKSDIYFEPKTTSTDLFKDKGSKHFGYVFHVNSIKEVTHHLNQLKNEHYNARHVCYAYSLGLDPISEKWSDDGEPFNSAGPPIMGQIQAHNLNNTLIAVVRYFGGTKLGVGGLKNAYKTAAKMAIEANEIVQKHQTAPLHFSFPYSLVNDVMRIIKTEGVNILEQTFEQDCAIKIEIWLSKHKQIRQKLSKLHPLHII